MSETVEEETAMKAALVRGWRRPRPGPLPVDQPSGIRILRDPEEIRVLTKHAAEAEYRQARRMTDRGFHFERMTKDPAP